MNFLKQLFGRKAQASPTTLSAMSAVPNPGEIWSWIGKKDSPWPDVKTWSVRVIDVRDGWVRYFMNNAFDDERETVESFCKMYRPQPSPRRASSTSRRIDANAGSADYFTVRL